jgi:N-acyl-D-aspartate/D-glutamate deacylase
VIRDGTVIDGTEADPVRAGVGISGGRIVDVGLNLARGEAEIAAHGHQDRT